jgi:nucleotide-binding universal stress UspA family protein
MRKPKKEVQAMKEIKKILFPYDLSENAPKILPYVLSISEAYNSTICLLHVVPELQKWAKEYISHTSPYASLDMFKKEALEGAEKAMDRVCEEQLQSCHNLQRRVVSGDPATEILKTIEAEDIDLVIMGTHGRKGLEHVILGSVAENVVKKSPVPVLVVNPYKVG